MLSLVSTQYACYGHIPVYVQLQFFLWGGGGWKLLHSVGIGDIVVKDLLRLVQVLNP